MCGFVSLNLLRLEAQTPGEVGLGVAPRDVGFDEQIWQLAERAQFQVGYVRAFSASYSANSWRRSANCDSTLSRMAWCNRGGVFVSEEGARRLASDASNCAIRFLVTAYCRSFSTMRVPCSIPRWNHHSCVSLLLSSDRYGSTIFLLH